MFLCNMTGNTDFGETTCSANTQYWHKGPVHAAINARQLESQADHGLTVASQQLVFTHFYAWNISQPNADSWELLGCCHEQIKASGLQSIKCSGSKADLISSALLPSIILASARDVRSTRGFMSNASAALVNSHKRRVSSLMNFSSNSLRSCHSKTLLSVCFVHISWK